MTRPNRHHGFTLVEMLITISVIGLLLGILAPALHTARQGGRQAVCASNVRQLQMANDLRANERGGRFVPGAAAIATENLSRWHGERTSTAEPFRPRGGALTPYLGGASESVRACPTFAPRLEELQSRGAGFETGGGGYGYNNAFVGVVRTEALPGHWTVQSDEDGAARHRFMQPTKTVAFADAAIASFGSAGSGSVAGVIEYSFIEPRFWPDNPSFRPDPSIHFRHGGRVNAAWLDGHVSGEERTFTWAGLIAPEDAPDYGLGWFGDDDSNRLFDYE